jgi:kynureninase
LSLIALEEALGAFDGVAPGALRARSEELTELFIGLVDARDLPGLELVTPRHVAQRGSQVTYRHPEATGLMAALVDRSVIGDVRGDLVRFGLAPAYVSRADVWDAVDHLAAVVTARAWETTARAPRQVP